MFNAYSRNKIKELITENGGQVVSSISKKTSFVLAGENMGPSKLKKATDLDISIISENQFKIKASIGNLSTIVSKDDYLYSPV